MTPPLLRAFFLYGQIVRQTPGLIAMGVSVTAVHPNMILAAVPHRNLPP